MAARKADEGNLSESDIEFFRREVKSKEPRQLTLITGTGDEAQKVLRDMIDVGASIQDGKLSEKHESAVDGNKMKIKQTIQIEESMENGTIEKEKFIDLTIADDMEQIDLVKELNTVIYTTDLKEHIDDTFQITDFSVKGLGTEDYPKNSQPYLNKAAFYCRKAREYRAKAGKAATEADGCGGDEKEVLQEIEKECSEVFSYCLQEAIYWKLKAEIYRTCELDKKRIKGPTKCSSCHVQSRNGVAKYVYIPTDRRNIQEFRIDLELTKVGLGVRYGVNSVLLVLKKIEECKEQNTLNMIVLLGIYGASFKDRGIIMVTEEGERNINNSKDVPNSEVEYFKNKTMTGEYLDIIKLMADENRIFPLDSKGVDQNKLQTKIQEFFEFKLRVTKGEKRRNELSEIGKKLYGEIATKNRWLECRVRDARDNVDELRVCDKTLIEFKKIQEFFGKQLTDIKTCLDKCNEAHPYYSQAKKRYEVLNTSKGKKPFYEDNPEIYLYIIIRAISLEKSKLADATILTKDISANLDTAPATSESDTEDTSANLDTGIFEDIRNNPKTTAAALAAIGASAVTSAGTGAGAGVGVGAVIGVIGGPIGMAVGATIGGAIGGAVGGVVGGGVSGISAAAAYTKAKKKSNPKK